MSHPFGQFLEEIPDEPLLGFRIGDDGKRLLITYPGEKGLLTTAPNRMGKGVSLIGPNAICHRWSMAMTDPKPENVGLFAWWRHEVLGQKVYIFDPIGIVADADIPPIDGAPALPILVNSKGEAMRQEGLRLRAGFNPLDMIGASRFPVADSKMVAAALVPSQGPNPFWPQSAQSLLAGYQCFVALDPYYPFPRTMRSLWTDLTESREETFIAIMKQMAQSTAAEGFAAREAIDLLDGHPETVKGYRKTLKTQAGQILDEPGILDCLSYTSLDFGMMQREPVTVFLALPGWASDIYASFFRLLLGCMFRQIERQGLPAAGSRPRRTLIMLDEFATLRKSETILEALPRMPGFGVQFWTFNQDLAQLRTAYGPDTWETFVSNAGVVQNFGGTLDTFSAEYLSKLTGMSTVDNVSVNDSNRPDGGGTTTAFTGRPVKFPHEISALNAGPGNKRKQLLIFSGEGTAEAERLVYYEDFPQFVRFMDIHKANKAAARAA